MTQPEAARQDDDEAARASAIPGAWARPASAFADETSVVRPDRARGGGSRALSLVVLGGLAVVAAGFAWGVTVALQALDDDASAQAAAPSPSAAISPDGPAPAAAPPVPDADPSFPSFPEARASDAEEAALDERAPSADEAGLEELDIDLPAPKLLRLARSAADDDGAKKKRVKRQVQKGKKQPARQTKKARPRPRAKASAEEAAPVVQPAAAAVVHSVVSLTREAEQLFAAGELSAARGVVDRALGMNRSYPRAHRTLAIICAKQGDNACARKGYETYLRLAPDAPDAPDVRRILGM